MPEYNYRFEEIRILTAERMADDVQAHIQITAANMRDGRLGYSIVVAESKEFEAKIVDAAAVNDELTAQGKMAFYDILFETGNATLKPEAAPTIGLIAEVLSTNPELNVVVVGHTDNEGTLDYNIGLSRDRAASVAEALVTNHGIAADRVTHAGVAFLAPVTSNATEAGRTLNRRVEIVVR